MPRPRVRLLAMLAVCASLFVTAPTVSAMPVCNSIRAEITFEEYFLHLYQNLYFETHNPSWINLAAATVQRIWHLETCLHLEECD